MLKASDYNLIIDCKDSNDTIIFNTLYGSLGLFNPEEFDEVRRIFKSPNENENIRLKKILKDQKFLLSGSVNELAIIENRKRHGIQDKNRLDIILMPTLDCNFSCVYCYEDKKPGKMGFETMNLLKKWISIEIPKFKLVLLSWFGGEPLLDIRTIEEFTSYANTVARENGIELIAHITTNGYSLSKEKIQRLIELKIFNYQITIDGIAETHNKLRPLKNGKQTFDKIFNNINLLTSMSPLVKVTLRVNFNHTNLHTVPVLLEMFPLQGRHQLRLALEPIFGSCEYNAVDNMLTDDISMTLTSYLTLASELGYDISVGKSSIEPGKLVYCYAERENQVVINFNGDIFKCSVTDFNKSNRVGYLDNNGVFVKNPEAFDKWMNIPLFEPFCKSCKFLPLCMGGCRKARVFDESTGSFCSLIPTNASYVLKQIAYKGFDNLVLNSQTEFL